MGIKQIRCSGTPYEVGRLMGEALKPEINGSITFYRDFLKERANLSWSEVRDVARKFLPYLETSWPEYLEEMKGLADGADVDMASIVALNVRTEIAYGMLSDGCTAFSWHTNDAAYIAQNWDWRLGQSSNIVSVHIEQKGKPTIHMMTEAGIIGKIGMNSAGVGVTLNAIDALGVSFDKLPCHLALRTVLNSRSREEAMTTLRKHGVGAACHITIADRKGCVGFECTSADIVELEMDGRGICTHSNHLVQKHTVGGGKVLEDSPFRLKRIQKLLADVDHPSMERLRVVLKDEENFPGSICRSRSEKSELETLFSIVMDLNDGSAKVKMGRPSENGEEVDLRP